MAESMSAPVQRKVGTPTFSQQHPMPQASLNGVPWPARSVLKAASALGFGQLTVRLPDGRELTFQGEKEGTSASITINSYKFAWPIALSGSIGAAEAFLSGHWESDDIVAVLELFAENRNVFTGALNGLSLPLLFERAGHLRRRNSKSGSKKNIHYHYDLGNNFYKRWLDPTMTYSSARFEEPGEDLSAAQNNKYRSLAENMELGPDHSVLEIGCGWGGFAEYAASEIGCNVTALTISREQLDFARKRIFEKGLNEKVEVRYQDYRDVEEKFDRIASIEMFEAVGEQYWPAYFAKVRDALKPGGQAGLQIITIDDNSFETYRRSVDFIQRYIFPGGMLPSPSALKTQVTDAGLSWKTSTEFGLDYAETLALWRDRFLAAWPEIRELGFDERFRRMWEYYLAYCEAGFRSGNVDVTQLTLSRS